MSDHAFEIFCDDLGRERSAAKKCRNFLLTRVTVWTRAVVMALSLVGVAGFTDRQAISNYIIPEMVSICKTCNQ